MSAAPEPDGASNGCRWLVHDDRVLATLEVAATRQARRRGLLGRDGVEGALLLRPARSVHTFGMRFPIDVAHVDDELRIVHLCTMRPNRLGRPVWRARAVIETEAGAFAGWGLGVGDALELR
jgi:uncharacterized membrane protein (UPF0127 family)